MGARRWGHAPWRLPAGNDGQTVRLFGFDCGGPLNDLLGRARASRTSRVSIAGVKRESAAYGQFDTTGRPSKRRAICPAVSTSVAHLLHVAVRAATVAVRLPVQFVVVKGLVVMGCTTRK